jgi:hypothetical protein
LRLRPDKGQDIGFQEGGGNAAFLFVRLWNGRKINLWSQATKWLIIQASMMSRFDIFSACREPFSSRSESCAFLRSARDAFGVLNLSYWFLGTSNDIPDRMSWFSTYDEGYVAVYQREVTPLKDRAFQLGFRQLLPLDWDELRRDDETVNSIHALAESFGVGRHGISIPIREPGLCDAMFSVNLDCDDRHWN